MYLTVPFLITVCLKTWSYLELKQPSRVCESVQKNSDGAVAKSLRLHTTSSNAIKGCFLGYIWNFQNRYGSSHRRFSEKKVLLAISQNSQESTSARVSFLIKFQPAYNFIEKETLAQLFSCEFCEIFKNSFFTELLWATASADILQNSCELLLLLETKSFYRLLPTRHLPVQS